MITDYLPGESVVLAMGHHSVTDGVQFFAAMCCLDKKADLSKLAKVTPPTFW
jgi:hypothetical protein